MEVLVLIVCAVVIGAMFYYNAKQNSQLTADGKIIDRGRTFMEQAEVFTLNGNSSQIAEEVRKLSYAEMKVAMTADGEQNVFRFAYDSFAGAWHAVLYQKEAPVGRLAYQFQFTDWRNRDGYAVGYREMNMLLTAVEKMFLSVDPGTQVQTQLLDTKTKHRFF